MAFCGIGHWCEPGSASIWIAAFVMKRVFNIVLCGQITFKQIILYGGSPDKISMRTTLFLIRWIWTVPLYWLYVLYSHILRGILNANVCWSVIHKGTVHSDHTISVRGLRRGNRHIKRPSSVALQCIMWLCTLRLFGSNALIPGLTS